MFDLYYVVQSDPSVKYTLGHGHTLHTHKCSLCKLYTVNWTVTAHYILQTAACTMHTVCCTLHTSYFKLLPAQCTQYAAYCTVCIVTAALHQTCLQPKLLYYGLHSVQSTPYSLPGIYGYGRKKVYKKVKRDTLHMTYDMWGRWTFFKNFRSLALTVWEWRFVEDILTKDEWLTQLTNLSQRF